jgi:hypothetical protein
MKEGRCPPLDETSCCALTLFGVVCWIGYSSFSPVNPQSVSSNSSKESERVSPKSLHSIENRCCLPLGDGVTANNTCYEKHARHNPTKTPDLETPESSNLIPIRCLSGKHLPRVFQILRMNLNICRNSSCLNRLIRPIPLRLFSQLVSLELHRLLEEHKLLFIDRKCLIRHGYERRNLGRTRVAPSRIKKPPHEFSEKSGVITASTTKVGRSVLRVSPTNSEKDTVRCLPPRTVSNREVFRVFAMSERYSGISCRQQRRCRGKFLHNNKIRDRTPSGSFRTKSKASRSELGTLTEPNAIPCPRSCLYS